MTHLADRFRAAVITLVTEGPIKQRLTRAYSEHLDGLRDVDLPRPMAAAYGDLEAALHRVPPVGSGTRVKASVQKMSVAEAVHYAEEIVRLYVELLRHVQRAEPLKVVERGGEESRPAHLVNGS